MCDFETVLKQRYIIMNGKECDFESRLCFPSLSSESPNFEQSACIAKRQDTDNSSSRCEYFSNRTRIRCPAYRKKDDLSSYGYCEKHAGYIKRIRSDAIRARRLFDPSFSKNDSDFEPDFLSDQVDETLEAIGENWPYVYESLYCDVGFDDPENPLRNAGVFTQKEVIREYLSALDRQKNAIKELRLIFAEKHRRLFLNYRKNGEKKRKVATKRSKVNQVDKKELTEHKANKKYGSYIKWRKNVYFLDKIEREKIFLDENMGRPSTSKASLESLCPSVKRDGHCGFVEKINHGKPKLPQFVSSIELDNFADEDDIVRLLLRQMLDYVDTCSQHVDDIIETKPCDGKCLPLSKYCSKHILCDEKQVFYDKCTECNLPVLPFIGLRKCRLHCGKSVLGPVVRFAGATRRVSIEDDLESELYVKLCVDHVKAQREHQKQQQQLLMNHNGVSSSSSSLRAAIMNNNNYMPNNNSHHNQYGVTVQQQQLEKAHHNQHHLDKDTCARVRPFVRNAYKNCSGKRHSSGGSASSASTVPPPIYSPQQSVGGMGPLTPAQMARRGGNPQPPSYQQQVAASPSPSQHYQQQRSAAGYNGGGPPAKIQRRSNSTTTTVYLNSPQYHIQQQYAPQMMPYHQYHHPQYSPRPAGVTAQSMRLSRGGGGVGILNGGIKPVGASPMHLAPRAGGVGAGLQPPSMKNARMRVNNNGNGYYQLVERPVYQHQMSSPSAIVPQPQVQTYYMTTNQQQGPPPQQQQTVLLAAPQQESGLP